MIARMNRPSRCALWALGLTGWLYACRSSAGPDAHSADVGSRLTAATPEVTPGGATTLAADVGAGPPADALSAAFTPDVAAADVATSASAPSGPSPMVLTPHSIATRGLRLRVGHEDLGSAAGAVPSFSGDGRVLGLATAGRVSFVDVRERRWLGAFDVTPSRDPKGAELPRPRLVLSPTGDAFALLPKDGPGLIAARGDGTRLGGLPAGSDLAWRDEGSLVVLVPPALVLVDRAGATQRRFEDAALADASSVEVLGDALYVALPEGVRPFDRETLAWSGPLVPLGGSQAKLCGVRGHFALLGVPGSDRDVPTILDLRSGSRQSLVLPDEVAFNCAWRVLAFPFAADRAVVGESYCAEVECWLNAWLLSKTAPRRIGQASPRGPFEMTTSPDGTRIAMTHRTGGSLFDVEVSKDSATPREDPPPLADLRLSPDGKRLAATRDGGRTVVVIDLETGAEVAIPLRRLNLLDDLDWTRDSAHILVVTWKVDPSAERGRLQFAWWSARNGRMTPPQPVRAGSPAAPGEEEFGVEDIKFGRAGLARVFHAKDGRIGIDYRGSFVATTPGKSTYRVLEATEGESFDRFPSTHDLTDQAGRWTVSVDVADDGEGVSLAVKALTPELQKHGAVRPFEPHLGPLYRAFMRPDGSLVTIANGVLAVWDLGAWLAGE